MKTLYGTKKFLKSLENNDKTLRNRIELLTKV